MEVLMFMFVVIYSFIICSWFLAGYFVIKITSPKEKVNQYFGVFFTSSLVALAAFLLCDMGYEINFWDAPGIWGAPGKESTIWGRMQLITIPLGFGIGILLNKELELISMKRRWPIRIWLAVFVALIMIVTMKFAAKSALETLG